MATHTLCAAALLSAAAWAQTTTPDAPPAPSTRSALIQAQIQLAEEQARQADSRAEQARAQAQLLQLALAQAQQVIAQAAPKPPLVDSPPIPRARAHATGAAMPARSTYLGVGVADLDANRAGALKLKETRGAEVTMVAPDSPAAKAGIRVGDVILDYNGQPVEGTAELQRLVHETPAGRQVKIGVWRNGAPAPVNVTIEEGRAMVLHNDYWPFAFPGGADMPPIPSFDIPKMITAYQNSRLGVECQILAPNSQFADFLGAKDGLLVLSVNKNSPAEKAGLKAGDVIVKADDKHIANHRDLSEALRDNRGKAIPLTVVHNKRETVLTLTLDDNGRPEKF